MTYIEYNKTAKYTMVAIISLMMLLTALAGINVVPVKAYEFTLVATVTENPTYGYYGGYHAIWAAIKNDLAAIGINVEITQYNEFNWWKRVWDVGWDNPWHGGGWDMTMLEWWLQPHALEPWFTSMIRADLDPTNYGYNIHPWNNSDADDNLYIGMTSFPATTRKTYLDAWQKEFMKDPPWINIYYPRVYEVMGKYVTGYDPSACWFYETQYLTLDNAMLQEVRSDRDENTLIYAMSEPLWALSAMFMDTYTDEQQATLQWRTLYKWSIDPFPTDGSITPREGYTIVPDMAADYPTYLNDGYTVRVPLRAGMVWQYNDMVTTVPITADDVVWTFETILDPDVTATGIGDFLWFLDNVTYVDPLTVDFNLLFPCPDILSLLSNDWGTGSIMPKHFLEGITNLRADGSNKGFSSPGAWMPVSGPFMLDPDNPPVVDDRITFIKNPSYYGYGLGWGPHNVDTFIMKWIKDEPARLAAIINNDVDFGEYPTAPVQTYIDLKNEVNFPYLRVVQYDYPASNPIWFNFNNEYLSNKYIRLAIANAINYDYIINTLLPPWGIETAYRGLTYIMPNHYYEYEGTEVQLYNTDIDPYTQNVTKAQEYMDRWKNSQVGATNPHYLDGAAGDANFDGVVDLLDFNVWRDVGWPYGSMPVPFLPGQDIDPDFNNDGSIDLAPDYYIYRDEVPGKIYFPPAYP